MSRCSQPGRFSVAERLAAVVAPGLVGNRAWVAVAQAKLVQVFQLLALRAGAVGSTVDDGIRVDVDALAGLVHDDLLSVPTPIVGVLTYSSA